MTSASPASPRQRKEKTIYESESKEVLADDFSKRIRNARNKLGMTQEELGKKINERRSVISSLESGNMRPDNKLMGKLEKALNIKLTEQVKEAVIRHKSSDKSFTIGDILKREGNSK